MKGSPGGWTAEGSYTQNVGEIHPREVQNFITAYNNNSAITISGSTAVWDYIDPTENPVDYPVLQPLLLATRKSCHQEGNWYLQKGDHSYRFSLMPHKSDWKQGWQAGIESNHPFYAVVNPPKNADADLPAEKSFFSLSAKNVVINAIKKCEDDNSVIVRVYEIEGHAAYPALKVPFKISAAEYTDIIEENGKKLPANADSMKIRVGKYAIETFKLRW
jgi:alpha-mannosidase